MRFSSPLLVAFLALGCGDASRNQGGEGSGAVEGQGGGGGGGTNAGGGGGPAEGEGEGAPAAAGEGEGEGEGEGPDGGTAGEGEGEGGAAQDDFCERFPDADECEGEEPLGDVCVPGDRQCAGGASITQCDDTGSFLFEINCAQPQVCHPPTAECVDPVCPADSAQCIDDQNRQFCNQTGSEYLPPSPCPEGNICEEQPDGFNVACSPAVCQTGSVECKDTRTLRTCNNSGTRWVEEECGPGQSCDEDLAECRDQICEPLESKCKEGDDTVRLVCDSSGLRQEERDCQPTQECSEGRCVQR